MVQETSGPENPSESLEDPKTLAKTMLQEGADIEAIIAETSLSRPTILGLKGSLIKAQKRLAATEDRAAMGSSSGNLEEEQINTDLNTDLKKEAQITNNMVVLARGKQRLKALDPDAYKSLHGGQQQPEGNSTSKTLADVELAQYIRTLRETAGHPNNNGGDSQGLQKQINDLREELHKKDVQNLRDETIELKQELKELRADLRNSGGSQSDFATVIKESSNLIGKALESPGVIRNYLLPDGSITIGKKADAPPLLRTQAEAESGSVLTALKQHGLVTQVLRRGD